MATTINVCDIVTVKSDEDDSFHREYDGTPRQWRVTSYLKVAIKPKFDKTELKGVLDEILFDTCQKVGPDNKRLVWCSQEEAEYVSLCGLCGAIARVGDCTVVGRVNWPESHIQEEKESAKRLIGKMIH